MALHVCIVKFCIGESKMVGTFDGKEFVVGTALAKRTEEPSGFEVVALDRKGYPVFLKFLMIQSSGFPAIDDRETIRLQQLAQKWADQFNGK